LFVCLLTPLRLGQDKSDEEVLAARGGAGGAGAGAGGAGAPKKQAVLEDFNIMKVLGQGAYGKVVLVERKEQPAAGGGDIYAMKMLKKEDMIAQVFGGVVEHYWKSTNSA
jgi:serine/threonine protein kinase